MSDIFLFLLEPTIVFEAQIDLASATYPLDELPFDGVLTGAYGDIEIGQTVLIGTARAGDDLGRTRVRKAAASDTLYVGRSSIGIHDGEITATDDAYITVLNDFRVWSKIPYIAIVDDSPYKTTYKDSDILVGTYTSGDEPPVANAGPPAAGTIDSGTGQLQVMLPHYAPNRSFATADGATISTYLWELPSGCTFAGGTSSSDSQIIIDCDPGFYWIALTVTDSNGNSHTTRTFVVARDSAGSGDGWEDDFNILRHRVGQSGQTMSVRFYNSIPETTYPDGTLCMVIDGEPASLSERDNVLFWGWHQNDPSGINVKRTATLHDTTLDFVDVAGRLDTLPGFSQVIYNDVFRLTAANPSITWEYMADPTWDKLLHYLLHWHSTALELADWQDSGTGDTFDFIIRETGGSSLYDQVNKQANSLVPERIFTCDRLGRLAIVSDPILQEVADRTATVQAAIGVEAWQNIQYTNMRPPRIHWLDDSALQTGVAALVPLFTHAPGDSPGQGEQFQSHGEQIAESQDTLNKVAGQRYARLNSANSHFQISLTEMANNTIDPAAMTWVTLTIPASVAAERGLNFTTERGIVHEMTFNYSHGREGVIRSVDLLWERETNGPAGVYVPPPVVPAIDDHDPYTPPVDVVVDPWTNPPRAYVLWDFHRIGRTYDIMAASPEWTDITGGIVDSGAGEDIIDVQYVAHTNNTMVGLFCLTDVGLFYTADCLTATPSWDEVLSLATVQATEAAPDTGSALLIGFCQHGLRPGAVHLFTQPSTGDTGNGNWPHAYSWNTTDFGQNWTLCDAFDELQHTSPGGTHGYVYMTARSCEWYRDAGSGGKGRIFARRMSFRYGLGYDAPVVYSDDDGDTWQKSTTLLDWSSNAFNVSGLRHPFPDTTDEMFVVGGLVGVSARPSLWRSTDFGDTWTNLGIPSGYTGLMQYLRVNQRYSEPNHVLAWAKLSGGDGSYDLIDSEDSGASWSVVYDPGVNGGSSASNFATPNGWPGDPLLWFLVRNASSTLWNNPVVHVTEDYFDTAPVDKTGDLATVFGGTSWIGGSQYTNDGFALPKIGVNA